MNPVCPPKKGNETQTNKLPAGHPKGHARGSHHRSLCRDLGGQQVVGTLAAAATAPLVPEMTVHKVFVQDFCCCFISEVLL